MKYMHSNGVAWQRGEPVSDSKAKRLLGPLGGAMALGVVRFFSRVVRHGGLVVVFQNEDFEARVEAALALLGDSSCRRLAVEELRRVVELPSREIFGVERPRMLCLGRIAWRSDKVLWAVGLTWFAALLRGGRRGSDDPARMATAWVKRVRALPSMQLGAEKSADLDGLLRALQDGRLVYP